MAFPSDIVLNNAAAVAKTFTATLVSPTEVSRVDTGQSDPSTPRVMIIRSRVIGNDKTPGGAVDQYTTVFKDSERDAVGNLIATQFSGSLSVPRNSAVGRTQIDDLIAFLKNFWVTANVDKILRGEK